MNNAATKFYPLSSRMNTIGKQGVSSPASSCDVHLFRSDSAFYIFVVNGSRVYEIGETIFNSLYEALQVGESEKINALFARYGLLSQPSIEDKPPEAFPIHSFSLAIAQKCNLACTYCYAQEGSFGGTAKQMSQEVALKSVDRLLTGVKEGERVNLAFLGGEPLINRSLLIETTEYAAQLAQKKRIHIGFSITTNGTLINESDGEFFEKYGFAVTISLDGVAKVHDQQRAFKNGKGSYEIILRRITPLLQMQKNMQVSARVTVTPHNLCLPLTLEELIRLGFHSVGFSPMLSSPTNRDEMSEFDLEIMLEQMITCGHVFEEKLLAGERFPFSNMVNAMREIHKGTHRPYPCGAGAGYLGVSAEGGLFACHRFVDDDNGAMGNIGDGLDQQKQSSWLRQKYVDFQEPCKSCWARYLCGGGCHHEVIYRGRPACDYIRGWLDYTLGAYVRLLKARPDYFGLTSSLHIAGVT